MKDRKYDIEIDGYRIRNNADFNRVDMSKSQRNRHHRRKKLGNRDWYKKLNRQLIDEIQNIRDKQDLIIRYGFEDEV